MILRSSLRRAQRVVVGSYPTCAQRPIAQRAYFTSTVAPSKLSRDSSRASKPSATRPFHTSRSLPAQAPTADALMENLNDLYATAKDEFDIAIEETEKKTVYAADDREAAHEAFNTLKEAYDQATSQGDPEVAKEVQSRVGQRLRELEAGIKTMDEMAMED